MRSSISINTVITWTNRIEQGSSLPAAQLPSPLLIVNKHPMKMCVTKQQLDSIWFCFSLKSQWHTCIWIRNSLVSFAYHLECAIAWLFNDLPSLTPHKLTETHEHALPCVKSLLNQILQGWNAPLRQETQNKQSPMTVCIVMLFSDDFSNSLDSCLNLESCY